MQRNRYEMLTDENLIEELRGGDSAITDFIMNKYKPMVRKKARAMFLLGGENEDLIQEGMIGLFKAIRDYETRQGTSFASFAELCVSRQMYSAIEASQRKKQLPLNSYVSLYEESVEEGKKVVASEACFQFHTFSSFAIVYLGSRIIFCCGFFRITGVIPVEQAVEQMKKFIVKSYGKKGEDVVNKNYAAVDRGGEYKTLAIDPAWSRRPYPMG